MDYLYIQWLFDVIKGVRSFLIGAFCVTAFFNFLWFPVIIFQLTEGYHKWFKWRYPLTNLAMFILLCITLILYPNEELLAQMQNYFLTH